MHFARIDLGLEDAHHEAVLLDHELSVESVGNHQGLIMIQSPGEVPNLGKGPWSKRLDS